MSALALQYPDQLIEPSNNQHIDSRVTEENLNQYTDMSNEKISLLSNQQQFLFKSPITMTAVDQKVAKPIILQPIKPEVAEVAPNFVYFGQMVDENNQRRAFFMDGDRAVSLKLNDIYQGTWQVSDISPEQIKINYLPTQSMFTLHIHESKL